MTWHELFTKIPALRALRDALVAHTQVVCKVTLDANSLWPEDQPVDGQGLLLLAIYREAVVARKAADETAGPWVFLCEGIDSGARIVNFRSGQRVHALPKDFVVAFTSGKTVEGRFATDELTGDAILHKGNTELLRLPMGLLNYLTGLKAKTRPPSSVAQPVVGAETHRESPRPIPSAGRGTTDGTGTTKPQQGTAEEELT